MPAYQFEIFAAPVSYTHLVVRDLCGHGIGTHMHEDPEIPNYRKFRRGIKLRAGMTVAVEPMINLGTERVVWMDDDWTVVTQDMDCLLYTSG